MHKRSSVSEGSFSMASFCGITLYSNIGVTMNTYTHLGLEDAQNEMVRLEELNRAKEEVAKAAGEKKPLTQRSFKAV